MTDRREQIARILCCDKDACLREKNNTGPCDALKRAKQWPVCHQLPELLKLMEQP